MRRDERGAATVLALFATLTMVLLGASLWATAFASVREVHIGHGGRSARAVAEAALATRMPNVLPSASMALGLGQAHALAALAPTPGVHAAVSIQRVGRELFILRADGTNRATRSAAAAGYGVWALEAGARLASAGAVVSAGGHLSTAGGGTVGGSGTNVPPHPSWGGRCSSLIPVADSLIPGGRMAAWGVDTTAAVRLGRLDQAGLLALATVRTGGVVTPAPVAGPTGCSTGAAGNWGDPAGGPCSGIMPIVAAGGDLTLSGGVGQGVLIVPGSLTVAGGARYFGVVLVGGDLTVAGGSAIHGMVRVGGDVAVHGSSIRGSSCAVLSALDQPVLRAPLPIPDAWLDPI